MEIAHLRKADRMSERRADIAHRAFRSVDPLETPGPIVREHSRAS
jgi:hypothetical protein